MTFNHVKHIFIHNKKYIVLVITMVLVVCVAAYFAFRQKPLEVSIGREIVLTKDGFVPARLVIHAGDTVVFRSELSKSFWPASDLHPTHEIYPEFDPKQPIKPENTWSFTFKRIGEWRMHDHLAPNYTGLIVVVDKDGYLPAPKASECGSLSNLSEKETCWNNQLQYTIDKKGLDQAFKLFVNLYDTEPSVPKSCHGWAHILGRAAYGIYKKDKNIILGKETTYCGYGFYHGFMEQLMYDTGDLKETRSFCKFAAEQLKGDSAGAFQNCVHGIGHGSINVDDVSSYGNFQKMVDTGLKSCELVLSDKKELRDCYDGAFNAMSLYAYKGEYNLSLNMADPYSICRQQKDVYKVSCYFELSGTMSLATDHNFIKAANMLLRDKTSDEVARVAIQKMSADFMQEDISKGSQEKNVKDCRTLPTALKDVCFNGIIIGFIAHGAPGKQHEQGIAFCKSDYLTNNERKSCYMSLLGQLVPKGSAICSSVDEQYQQYCRTP